MRKTSAVCYSAEFEYISHDLQNTGLRLSLKFASFCLMNYCFLSFPSGKFLKQLQS